MKLLIILPRVPFPLDKGDKLRAYHQIKQLSKDHEIILFALSESGVSGSFAEQLRAFCSKVVLYPLDRGKIAGNLLRSFFEGIPFQVGYFYHPGAQRLVDELIRDHQPDHIYCQLIRTAPYAAGHEGIPNTLDYMDAFSKGIERRLRTDPFYMRPLLRMEHRRLLAFERRAFDMFQNKTIISDQDKSLIPHPRRSAITVVPNGIDTEWFRPQGCAKTFDIIFHGNMDYPPNVESVVYLVRDVMPLVWRTLPGARLIISGANPCSTVRRLASERVKVSGWVDDIRDNYARSRLMVAPMQISIGLQNKLLEAMAMGLPCVTSSLANNALGARPGEQIRIADSPQEYADHIVELLTDDVKSRNLGSKGRAYVLENFSWPKTTALLSGLMEGGQEPLPTRTAPETEVRCGAAR